MGACGRKADLISLRPGLEPLRTKSAVRSLTRSFSSSCCMAVCLHGITYNI